MTEYAVTTTNGETVYVFAYSAAEAEYLVAEAGW